MEKPGREKPIVQPCIRIGGVGPTYCTICCCLKLDSSTTPNPRTLRSLALPSCECMACQFSARKKMHCYGSAVPLALGSVIPNRAHSHRLYLRILRDDDRAGMTLYVAVAHSHSHRINRTRAASQQQPGSRSPTGTGTQFPRWGRCSVRRPP